MYGSIKPFIYGAVTQEEPKPVSLRSIPNKKCPGLQVLTFLQFLGPASPPCPSTSLITGLHHLCYPKDLRFTAPAMSHSPGRCHPSSCHLLSQRLAVHRPLSGLTPRALPAFQSASQSASCSQATWTRCIPLQHYALFWQGGGKMEEYIKGEAVLCFKENLSTGEERSQNWQRKFYMEFKLVQGPCFVQPRK